MAERESCSAPERLAMSEHLARSPERRAVTAGRLPILRIGIAGGLVGMLCCVGPTILALLGIVSAATAFAWANDLYDNYAWWFRAGGLAVLAVLVWMALRRRNQCSLSSIWRLRWRLITLLIIAVGSYGVLYAVTTWLGAFA
uniref:Mercuric transport protein MerT n=2 Tax=Mycobacterium riyadhense TaxID=486698 RepID=A0A653EBV2_9MYCO|nr:hypothetical protein BIN_B_00407 [Mycobacterium riyadhense]